MFDVAMHLIATHHGRGRPHFPKGGFDPDCERRSEQIQTEAIRRFARLQRRYGWWRLAWLENLLRCADASASADQDAEDDSVDSEVGEP
jgi:CRISPR-associated endonuclease/helicase Cas3